MRKLAIACVSVAAAVFLSFYFLPLRLVTGFAIGCGVGALTLLLFRRRGDLAERCFLCVLGAAVGFAAYALHWNATLRYAELWDDTEQTMTVRVMEMPTDGDYYTRIHVQRTEAPKLDMMLYDYEEETPELRPGELLQVRAKLRRADLFHGEQNNNYISKDIYLTGTVKSMEPLGSSRPTIRTVASACSGYLSASVSRLFPEDTAVFMRALMLGDKTDFYKDTALYARMRGAGFMHIVAVSGMHIAFLVGMIQLLFGARPASSAAGILLIWFFVFMTGASPSAVRAGIMQTILIMAPVFRRENDGPTSLAAALALILLLNPFSCASISLQMSFSAMAGMILLAEPLTNTMLSAFRLREDGAMRAPVAVVASSLAVLIVSAPVTVWHFGTLALYSPLTNLLGLWAVSLCFCGGWLSCLGGLVWLPLGRLLAVPAAMLARYLIALAGVVCRLPHHLIAMRGPEMLLWMFLCYLLAGVAWRCRGNSRFRVLMPICLCALSLAAGLWSAEHRYRDADAVIAALDVGQGECVCVLSGDQTLMFDCGGLGTLDNAGETAANWLEAAGRRQVDTLVLSHLHEDHCNGVEMLLELLPVSEIILSPNADRDEGLYDQLAEAARRHGTAVTLLAEDTECEYGDVRLRMFAPPDTGTENERCIISLVSIGDYDMIFTGDSPKKAEVQLVESYDLPDAELLIVGHHGSQSSSDESFLRAIQAEDAIISVGYNNYGHPTREVLARLQVNGYHVYRTDRNGTVEIRVNGR
ncbi:MAG: DNA internalization-related competence protein ComEC/Rec2 [Oscillospiraceae bacterium]|nr:DNA internalization-related competence protein ComEC/Rec2 [Oscillospiraceae bacterium]